LANEQQDKNQSKVSNERQTVDDDVENERQQKKMNYKRKKVFGNGTSKTERGRSV
jgi:hypothetical protein